MAPRTPPHEFAAIIDHALDSRGLKAASPEVAAWLSLISYIRHVLTDYDELLEQGFDVESARHFVITDIDATLQRWGVRRRLAEGE